MPTELERRGDFSQSQLSGAVRTIYNPFTSTLDADGRVVRQPFAGNVIPSSDVRSRWRCGCWRTFRCPTCRATSTTCRPASPRRSSYWNFSQRVDLNISDNLKVFARAGVFKADLYQDNPIGSGAGFFPLSGSNRDGFSIAGDAVWVMSNRTTLNVRGSFYNMVDEFYNPALLLGAEGLASYWPNSWYDSLYNSGYVYYPALDVTSGTGTNTNNRLGRQGREWYQHPDAWTISARMNRYQGDHSLKWGGETRAYYGEAARFEPINLVFNSALTANSSDSPQVATTGNQWATFLLGALDNQTSARLVPLQTTNLRGYSAYFQDDWKMGEPADAEPRACAGSTSRARPIRRTGSRRASTSPSRSPRCRRRRPTCRRRRAQLMAAKGYEWSYNGAWQFATADDRSVVEDQLEELHAARRRELSPGRRCGGALRLRALHDADQQRPRHARRLRQPVHRLRADHDHARPGQRAAAAAAGRSVPGATTQCSEPTGQALGRYTGLGSAVSFDDYQLRPQINDRYYVSFQKDLWKGLIFDAAYFYNWGSRVAVHAEPEHARSGVHLRVRRAAQHPGAESVPQLPDAVGVPRRAAEQRHRRARQPAGAVPAVRRHQPDQHHRRTQHEDAEHRSQGAAALHSRASASCGPTPSSAIEIEDWLGDDQQFQVLQSGGREGWEWQPVNPALPEHRMTGAVTWQILPFGRDRAFLSNAPAALDYAHRRLAVHRGGPRLLGPPGAVHQRAGRQRQPEARFADVRSLVRYQRCSRPSRRSRRGPTRSPTTA